MKRALFLIVGILLVVEVIYKIINCPMCDGSRFGYKISATADYVINIIFIFILFTGAYSEHKKMQDNKA